MSIRTRPMSPNLQLNQLIDARAAEGESLIHLGFGESRLPVFGPLADRLAEGVRYNGYGPVSGRTSVREAVAGYFTRRRLPADADQVIVAPGSKPLLMALFLALPGDVVLPKPAWNTYAPQADLAGKAVIPVPIPAECGGFPDPALLRDHLAVARRAGHDPRILVLTLPDNPTGTTASPALVREVCAIADAENLFVISDEIYRDVVHDPATPILSPAEVLPDRTVVTTGLSKSLAIGGWRIGAARFPDGPLGWTLATAVASVASEIWSSLAGPMQAVAEYAFAEPPELRAHITACTRLHGVVARAVHEIMVGAGADCRPPTGAFYIYPDFEPVRERLAVHGIEDSESLRDRLLDDFGIAVLAGHLLGDEPGALRFKAATSTLYGETDELRWAALRAEDPLSLPHIAVVLERIAESFGKLCG
jgi:aspartate aminotransferase